MIHELYDEKDLFRGLMAPLGHRNGPPDDVRPTCLCEGFARLDWEPALERLQTLVSEQRYFTEDTHDTYLAAVDLLASIYDATFGDANGRMKSPTGHKMALIWIYMMESAFVTGLQRLDTVALLLLAYYAPLLKTMDSCWFVKGWPEHILNALPRLMKDRQTEMLRWPIDAVERL